MKRKTVHRVYLCGACGVRLRDDRGHGCTRTAGIAEIQAQCAAMRTDVDDLLADLRERCAIIAGARTLRVPKADAATGANTERMSKARKIRALPLRREKTGGGE